MTKDLNYKPGDIIIFYNQFRSQMDIGKLIEFFNYTEGDKHYIVDWWFSQDDPENGQFPWSHKDWGQDFAKATNAKEAVFRILFDERVRKGIY